MTRHDIEDVYELSPLQQGMLFHSLATPEAGVYLIQLACVIEGPLDPERFDAAWQEVAARRPVLRTSFHWETLQKPLQVVHRDATVLVHHEDWRGVSRSDRAARLASYLEADRQRPVPLDRAPVFHVALFQLADAQWQAVWSFPHILLEGWSAAIVLREVLAACEPAPAAAAAGAGPGPVPRYRDYVAWLQRQDSAAAEQYWRRTLAGFSAPTPLAIDRVARDGPERYQRARAVLPAAVTERLQALARQRRLTLNTIFQGAWALLLSRYSSEHDVVFGSVVSGREIDFPGIDALVGLCVNTLPWRVYVDDSTPVAQWLHGLQAQSAAMRAFEYCSLVDIQQWSDMPRGTPLFESIFVFENWAAGASAAGATGTLRVTAAESHEGGTGYPLVVEVAPGQEIRIGLAYDARRLEGAAVERFLAHYEALLTAIAERPDALVGQLSPITPDERETITRAWNDTAAPHDAGALVHDLVLRQAAKTPGAEAVRCGGEAVTYAQLVSRSGRLASHLASLGVGPGVLVAIGVERSIDMVVALIAVLRAGGAYLPLDPAFPPDRLAYMLADARCPVVLVDARTDGTLAAPGAVFVRVDAPETWQDEMAVPLAGPTPRDLAYVIYTSGSTGAPKGVQIPHGAVVNFLEAMQREFGLTTADRLLAVTTLSFDIAGLELLLPLMVGAGVVVADRETASDGVRLAEAIATHAVTVMQATPATWRQLVDAGWRGAAGLRILCGGESLPRELADDLLTRGSEVWNLYGPTETTIWSAIERVKPDSEAISIGRPIANTQIYVLDGRLEPVPPGAPGDLYIGGLGVAAGYLHRPALTAERFIPDPFAADPDARLYRTGDIARYQADGRLEWLGRADHQVKLRGFRIELGEIEASLRQHAGVVDAVAIVREDRPGDRRLVAYVKPQEGAGPETPALRAYLQSRLPEYMMPSAFVTVTEWPRTPNGKINRGVLPPPDASGSDTDTFAEPRDPVEDLLAGIWADVLGVARVGIHDNFFELGGHSLLATRVVSRVRAVLDTDLSIRQLFQAPTVARLADTLRAAGPGDADAAPPLARADRAGGVPLSFAQERLWFVQQLDPQSTAYNIARAILLRGPLDVGALQRSFAELIRRHETLRSAVTVVDGRPVVTVGDAGAYRLEVEEFGQATGPRDERVNARVAAETSRPFDLSRAPLLRTTVLRLGDEEHLLVVVMHHLVADAWSLGIVARELGILYSAFVKGEPSPLPALPVQYPDVAAWQRAWLQGEVLARELAYWSQHLEGAPLVLDLPADRPRPAIQTARGQRHTVLLPERLTEALRVMSRQQGVTLFMTLLAAFDVLLQRHCGMDDFLVGSPIAGRTDVDTEGLVGLFANTLVLRADLRGDPTVSELLARVRATALDAYAHQHVPFERLVDELHPERDLGRNPVVQAVFAFQNLPAPPLELAGLTWLPYELGNATSPFDLTLFVQDVAQGLAATFQYSTDLFDENTIARLHRHWQRVLETMAERPAARLSTLTLMDEAGQQRLQQWNATASVYPSASTISAVFEAQVRRAPERTALTDAGAEISYDTLNRRANRLAHHLTGKGIGHGARVGICLDRSTDLVVAMLGILKAGGAYVPLDPSYPRERLAWMAADAGLGGLVTDDRGSATFEGVSTGPVVRLDRDAASIAGAPDLDMATASGPDDLAYVIYTSGSTGQPKGVAVPHRGVLRLVLNTDYVRITTDDVFLLAAPASFDASTFEVWGGLLNGARCAVFADRLPTPATLGDALAREGVTVLWLTASLFNTIVDHDCGVLAPVRQLLVGGEALSVSHVRRALTALPSVRLINGYGPTESTTFSCCHAIPPDLPAAAASVPIGRAIANTRAYVLDACMQAVPAGVRGELYIGGDGLAWGYLDRPALTAERFVPDPFSPLPGGRLYRTGDVVRRLDDGTLLFVGRHDDQVKIRGFRIEPGEIEAVIRQHPDVRDAAVVVRADRGARQLVAYWVAGAGVPPVSSAALRAFLRDRLPEYMVPSAAVQLEELPLSANGKVDRSRLPAPAQESRDASEPRTAVELEIAAVWREALHLDAVGVTDNFFDVGGHSLLLVQVHSALEARLGLKLAIVDLFRFPTIRSLAMHLAPEADEGAGSGRPTPRGRRPAGSGAVAIVGLAGRFPGAANVDAFWRNLEAGVESVSFFTPEELVAAGVDPDLVANPGYVRARAVLDDIDRFDAGFFGYSPSEAALIDPQQRLFLECAWHALEDAACDPTRYREPIGVYAGVGTNTYVSNIVNNRAALESAGAFQTTVSSDKDFLATRVSYKLDLTGPGIAVQTGCSTSLVAVHVACRALVDGDCRMAIAGGVRVTTAQRAGYMFEPGGILSPDGHCRAFDADARGTTIGSGVGVVVLKRLEDAIHDRDRIVAVIRGSAINNDGAGKVGYTAPSVAGQARVIGDAMDAAGVDPSTVSYIEAHGTGTALGDPIEMAALGEAFAESSARPQSVAIGSLKTNVGHLDAAAGVASLIKVALAMDHAVLPPSLHFERPNPEIDFSSSAFYVNTRSAAWRPACGVRRAGVSSFGIGGTNAHVVLEEAPAVTRTPSARTWHVLPLSARSEAALDTMRAALAEHLRTRPDEDVADVAFTLQVGRRAFDHRSAVVCRDRDEAIAALAAAEAPRHARRQASGAVTVAFLFPGQGAQHAGMARELYASERVFRDEVDRAAGILVPQLGLDLRELLHAVPDSEEARRIDDTAIAQPALFAVEYALARLWMSWGVVPSACLGHSIGEYVAACLAGVFPFEDALRLVAVRGRLMQATPAGGMLAVGADADALRPLMSADLAIAAVNAPGMTVVSGPEAAVRALADRLAGARIEAQRLHTSHAFHSALMDAVLPAFEAEVRAVRPAAPRIPFVSNVTGDWITAEQATDPAYWATHLRNTVRFAAGLQTLAADPQRVLLEVGPGQTLTTLARRQVGREARVVVASLPHPRAAASDTSVMQGALAHLWTAGVAVDWNAVWAGEARHRVSLPGYAFERQRYWIDATGPSAPAASTGKRSRIESWFYVPSWTKRPRVRAAAVAEPRDVLLLTDDSPVAGALAEYLKNDGHAVVRASRALQFEARGDRAFGVEPTQSGFEALLDSLAAAGIAPAVIVHAWSIEPAASLMAARAPDEVHGLMELARAVVRRMSRRVEIAVVASRLHAVPGGPPPDPFTSMMLGPCRVIPQEHPAVSCRTIDVPAGVLAPWQLKALARQVATEVLDPDPAAVDVSLRGLDRLVLEYEPMPLGPVEDGGIAFRRHGVYVITGGLGSIGLTIAGHLAREHAARLVLIGRTGIGDGSAVDAPAARRRQYVAELEAAGAEVLVVAADVADAAALSAALSQAEARFGRIDGVIHAAGLTDRASLKPLRDLRPADCDAQFRPKVAGAIALSQAIGSRPLDFCILTSSLSAVLGGLGMSAYAAANVFLNALAHAMNATGPTRWTSLEWDGWTFAARNEARRGTAGFDMQPDEGVETLRRVLAGPATSEVVVSTGDLRRRLDEWVARNLEADTSAATAPESRHARPELESAYVAPATPVEETLAGLWQAVLGIDRVGVDDNFFELGGHSLMALRLVARMQDAFEVEVPVQHVFNAPTVRSMAAVVSEARLALDAEMARIEAMLRLVEELPEEEIRNLLQAGHSQE